MRLDQALAERGLARSRSHAHTLISSGAVTVDGEVVRRPATSVGPEQRVETMTDPYVSRGAHKLLGALDDLELTPYGRALDAGASTGGFTQVLLERGATAVVAVDVGTDQLDPLIRQDPRVRARDRTNLRDLTLEHVDGTPVDLVVADVSFISLGLVLGPLSTVTRPDGRMLVLVKPQFEVGREQLGKGGVVRSPDLHRAAVDQVIAAAAAYGWFPGRAAPSRVPGPAGNREFFLLLTRTPPDGPDAQPVDTRDLVRPGAASPRPGVV